MEPLQETIQELLRPDDVLWRQWADCRSVSVRNQLFEYYAPWCRKISSSLFARYHHNLMDWHDYMNTASIALLGAIEKFESTRGLPFEGYAYPRVKGAIVNAINDYAKDSVSPYSLRASKEDAHTDRMNSVHSEEGDALTNVLDAVVGLAFGMFLELGVLQAEENRTCLQSNYDSEKIAKKLVVLSDELHRDERFVIKSHYFQHLSFKEIAEIMDVSRSRVSQIHRNAILNLRRLHNESQ